MTHALIAAGLAALAIAHPAAAQSSATSTQSVSYADLDLSTVHGRATLDARVRTAARQVCEIGTEEASLRERVEAKACFAKAVSSAQQQFASIEASRSRTADRLR